MIDFENIESKFNDVILDGAWATLVSDFKSCDKIYLIGNGGLHFTAAHAATDCTRLISDKVVYSFDTTGYITSCANDHGYENTFIRWLQTADIEKDKSKTMIIGMSCSGNSKNITRTLSWAQSRGYKLGMITGQQSKRLEKGINELSLNCKYFHTVEVLCLILFYQMIHETGNACPTIVEEIKRKDPWLS